MEETRQPVPFYVRESLFPCQGIAVIDALTEEAEPSVVITTFGNPTHSAIIGLLQVALDRQRDLMRRSWEV